jgi:apolipoprotein N-acyltransferase
MMIDIISFIILIVSAIIGNVVIKKIDHKKSMIYLIWSIFICFLGCVLLYFRLM